MSFSTSYTIWRHAPVFIGLAGDHPGRANCKHCGLRILRSEPRIGWHGRYYHMSCWWTAGHGREFLSALLSCLSDDMLVEAGLRVEHEEPEEPAPRTGSFNLNDFGVRMLRDIGIWQSGQTYRVLYFTRYNEDGGSGARFNNDASANPEEIVGARILVPGTNTNASQWYPRRRNFEVVLLDSTPEPAEPEPLRLEPIDDRLISHTGEEVVAGDIVRFIREVYRGHDKSRHLGQEFRVSITGVSSSHRGRQWFALDGASGINFYDDEIMLVSPAGNPEPEWVNIESASELSVGDTVRIKPDAPRWGRIGPGSVCIIDAVHENYVNISYDTSTSVLSYDIESLEVQR